MNVKALLMLIMGLIVIGSSNTYADFSLEAKCLKDRRTGIIITYDDGGKPIVVKKCKNPENAELFYWRIQPPIPAKNGHKRVEMCFASGSSPMENVDSPQVSCDRVKKYRVDIWNGG